MQGPIFIHPMVYEYGCGFVYKSTNALETMFSQLSLLMMRLHTLFLTEYFE